MTTWIIAYNKDGNTETLKTESDHQPDIDEAVERVTQMARREFGEGDLDHEHDPDLEDTPATRLASATALPSLVFPKPESLLNVPARRCLRLSRKGAANGRRRSPSSR